MKIVYRRQILLCSFLILAFVLSSPFCFSQKSLYEYEQFTTVEGLPSNECHEVFQDHEGYIWIGTDNGLARFDGNEFKIYGEEEGLGERVIFDIKEDSLGRIWVVGLDSEFYILDREADLFRAYKYLSLIHISEPTRPY